MSTEIQVPAAVTAVSEALAKVTEYKGEGLFDSTVKPAERIQAALGASEFKTKSGEEITLEQIVAVKAFENTYVAAEADNFAAASIDQFGKDKALKSTSFATKFCNDKVATSMQREHEITIPGRNGAPTTKETRSNYLIVKHKTQTSGAVGKVKAKYAAMSK